MSKDMRPKVMIESPFKAGQGFTRGENQYFALRICQLALSKGYNPFAMHLFYPQFMEDSATSSHNLGIRMGLEWGAYADEAWFCLRTQEKMTDGMHRALEFYRQHGLVITHKTFLPNVVLIEEKPDDES